MSSCNACKASSSVSSLGSHISSSPGPSSPFRPAGFRPRGPSLANGGPTSGFFCGGAFFFFGRGIFRANARALLRESCASGFLARLFSAPARRAATAAELILRRFAENSFVRSAFARCVCRRLRACVVRYTGTSIMTCAHKTGRRG